MINQNFAYTISALCYSMIQHRCHATDLTRDFPHNDAVLFVQEQYSRMPDYLRFPIFLLTLAFDLWGLVQRGTLFHQQSPSERWRQIEAWTNSSIRVCQDLMRFYESLVVFYYYSEL